MTETILNTIESIAEEPSTTKKLAILKDAWSPLLEKVMEYAYNPKKMYGISFVEPKVNEGSDFGLENSNVWYVLDGLIGGLFTGNEARRMVENMMICLDKDSAEVFRRIIQKDMRCGINTTTINKIKKGLIQEPEYMRCSLPSNVKLESWPWKSEGVIVQLKADGMFMSATKHGDNVTFMSRSGEIMPSEALKEIQKELEIILDDGWRIDGEILVYNNEGRFLPRHIGNGILNSLRQGGLLPDGYGVYYFVWDLINPDLIGDKNCPGYKVRFSKLIDSVRKANHLEIIKSFEVKSKEDALELCANWMKEGMEGAILKHPEGQYKNGTSKHQVKIKIEADVDLEVTGFIEGAKGKKTEFTFGALTYKSSDGLVTGSTSGFTDKLRAEINSDRDSWIGAIITVRANDIVKGEDSETWALSHPRFIERRFDKSEADNLSKIKEIFQNARGNFK